MKASEARKQALRNQRVMQSLQKYDAIEEFDRVLAIIREEVRKCQYSVFLDFELKPGTVLLLEEKGYEVREISGSHWKFSIMWSK